MRAAGALGAEKEGAALAARGRRYHPGWGTPFPAARPCAPSSWQVVVVDGKGVLAASTPLIIALRLVLPKVEKASWSLAHGSRPASPLPRPPASCPWFLTSAFSPAVVGCVRHIGASPGFWAALWYPRAIHKPRRPSLARPARAGMDILRVG